MGEGEERVVSLSRDAKRKQEKGQIALPERQMRIVEKILRKDASQTGSSGRCFIFSHSKNVAIGECIRGVELMASVLTEEEMKNHIEFL